MRVVVVGLYVVMVHVGF